MLSLRKIKELKGYRFFQSYVWDESACKLFERSNIIYGWNGSGKTTLCDFFKDLGSGALSIDGATCSLIFQDSISGQMRSITQASLGSIPYAFKVFHQDYIQENIKKDAVKHIFTVGKEQAEKLAEAKKLRTQAGQQETAVKQLSIEYTALVNEFDRLKTSKARTIKDSAKYSNAYNKNSYDAAHRALAQKKILPDEEYQKAMTAIRSQPLPALELSIPVFIQSSVKEYICNILEQTPVNKVIDALQRDAVASSWVESGVTLHEEKHSTVCLFCGNRISQERYEELRSHFNKSYRELSEKIDKAIILLNEKHKQFEAIKRDLPNVGLLYQEFQQQYQEYIIAAKNLCDHYMTIIVGIIDILQKKKEDMINEALTAEFINLVDQLSFDYKIFENIKTIITEHNVKTQEFQESIWRAQKAVELHLVSIFADEFSDFEKRISEKEIELAKQKKTLAALAYTD